jgi:hypothetical protein
LGTNVSKKEGQEMLGKFLFLSTAILALNFSAAKAAPEDVPEHDLNPCRRWIC